MKTIKQLREYLSYLQPHHDDDVLKIVVKGNRLGSMPSVDVKYVIQGSDWENHTLLIYPEEPLVKEKTGNSPQ